MKEVLYMIAGAFVVWYLFVPVDVCSEITRDQIEVTRTFKR